MKPDRLLARIRAGHLRNIAFDDFCHLAESFGFEHSRTRGSHRIYDHPRIDRELVLVPDHAQARPYQVRAFVRMIDEYSLKAEDR